MLQLLHFSSFFLTPLFFLSFFLDSLLLTSILKNLLRLLSLFHLQLMTIDSLLLTSILKNLLCFLHYYFNLFNYFNDYFSFEFCFSFILLLFPGVRRVCSPSRVFYFMYIVHCTLSVQYSI